MQQSGPWQRYAQPTAPAAPVTQPRRSEPRARPAMPQIRFADDADALIRTVIGEAANEPDVGQQAVAAVALNRARSRGLTPSQVVLERNQFEPWGNPETARRLLAIRPDSPEYRRAAAAVQRAMAGEDPTNGASHFYAPRAQAALGRQAPAWDDGSGFDIGGHRFFRIEGQGTAAPPPAPAATPSGPWARYAAPVTQEQAGLSDAAMTAMAGQYSDGEPVEVEIAGGVQNVNGRAILTHPDGSREDAGPWDEYQANGRRSQSDREARVERLADPEYQQLLKVAEGRASNIPDWLLSVTGGATLGGSGLMDEILGGVDYIASGGNEKAAQAARDAVRDEQKEFEASDPELNLALQIGGGLLTPGLKGTGDFIAGARGAERLGRAAVVGTGYGALSGTADAEGSLIERLPETVLGAGVGASTAGILDAGMQRAGAGALRRAATPSPARLLSREGVTLTPGQMLESTPIAGPMLRGVEDAASSIPFAGSAIAGARNEGIETFNRAALNRALAPIGESLPRNTKPGYGAVEDVQRRLGAAYEAVLPDITANLDQQLYDDIAVVLDTAATEMQPDQVKQLVNVLTNRVFRGFEESDAPITGEQFKRIESELGALARQYNSALDPTHQAFGGAVQDIRSAVREMIARQNPAQAARIQRINQGYANLVRIERAAGSGPAEAAEGVFTPTQLGIAARQGTSRGTRATGSGLLQDLATAGRQVLPSKVGDSGTAMRGATTAIVGGGAAGLLSPGLAVPVIAVAGAYSKPAQAALNAIYRSTDRQTADSGLAELQRLAGRNPALQQYYRDAVEAVRRAFQPQSPETGPAATGLLSPTGQ